RDADERHGDPGSRRAEQRERDERRARRRDAGEEPVDARPAAVPRPTREQHRRAAEERKDRARGRGLARREADGVAEVGRRPGVEGLAQEREAERDRTGESEGATRPERGQERAEIG